MLCTECRVNECIDYIVDRIPDEICYECMDKKRFITISMNVDEIPDELLKINYHANQALDLYSYRLWLHSKDIDILAVKIPIDEKNKYEKYIQNNKE